MFVQGTHWSQWTIKFKKKWRLKLAGTDQDAEKREGLLIAGGTINQSNTLETVWRFLELC